MLTGILSNHSDARIMKHVLCHQMQDPLIYLQIHKGPSLCQVVVTHLSVLAHPWMPGFFFPSFSSFLPSCIALVHHPARAMCPEKAVHRSLSPPLQHKLNDKRKEVFWHKLFNRQEPLSACLTVHMSDSYCLDNHTKILGCCWISFFFLTVSQNSLLLWYW